MGDFATRGRFLKTFSHSGVTPRRHMSRISSMLDSISAHNGVDAVIGGDRIEIFGSGPTYRGLFDLYNLRKNYFQISDYMTKGGGLWIAGKMITSIATSGITFDTNYWHSGVVTEAKYVYLEISREANTVTIIMANTLPTGSAAKYDYTEIIPLWYFPWNSNYSIIDIEMICDMRLSHRWPAGA